MSIRISNGSCRVALDETPGVLWSYSAVRRGRSYAFAPPVFQIDGRPVQADLRNLRRVGRGVSLPNGSKEYRAIGTLAADPTLSLELVFRLAESCPVVRFRYVLHSEDDRRLTKAGGADELSYLGLSLAGLTQVREVRFSQYNHKAYTYMPHEEELGEESFAAGLAVMGPMLTAGDAREHFLVAYEHGSTSPDAYLRYHLDGSRTAVLRAVKGNYYTGQVVGPDRPFETIWFQAAAVAGDQAALARAYREFMLKHQTQNLASRRPYIFYNTWGHQCRTRMKTGHYRDALQTDAVLHEIDVAHRMGIDVYVLDAGWFTRCGDWPVDPGCFPTGLGPIKARLDSYGMKLGLWFSTQVGTSSPLYEAYKDCAMSWRGTPIGIWSVWESEPGQHFCLVSRYVDEFAQQLIRLVKETGVTYFKWDAFGHYGCDEPHHLHGDAGAPIEERGQCYTFLFDRFMQTLADRVGQACPETICDFDITEPFRNVGLGFLSSGKYFLINDGPYPGTYDMKGEEFTPAFAGVFGRPGPARAWNCRVPLVYDKWIPSVCFLVHYLPDDPASSQWINLASLILGHNGIWGSITGVSDEGAERIGDVLGRYKQVRDDITESTVVITGAPGDSPEIYEKVSARTGRGAVCVFTNLGVCADASGGCTYVTRHPVEKTFWATEGTAVSFLPDGRAAIRCAFDGAGAKIVLFGAQ